MKTLQVLFSFIVVAVPYIIAAPVDGGQNLYYNALKDRCSILSNSTIEMFTKEGLLKNCQNWTEINQTTMLTKETENNVLCLLYFDTFVVYCKELISANVSKIPDFKNFSEITIDGVCKNLSLFSKSKQYEHSITKTINGDGDCYKLCSSYGAPPLRECSLAYHFTNFNANEYTSQKSVKALETPIQSVPAASLKTQKVIASKEESVNSSQLVTNPIDQKKNLPSNPIKGEMLQTKGIETLPLETTNNQVSQSIKDVVKTKTVEVDNKVNGSVKPQAVAENAARPPLIFKDVSAKPNENEREIPLNEQDNQVRDMDENKKLETVEQEEDTDSINIEKPKENQVSAKQTPPVELRPPNEEAEEEGDTEINYSDNETKTKITAGSNNEKNVKPSMLSDSPVNANTTEELDGESYFFSYFMVVCVLFVLGYVGYHNRQKVLALVLEGKKGKRQYRGRRPNSANYHKLDSNLEEAISSTCTKNSSHVIY